MRALITGVTGFIGGALASALYQAGWQVTVLVRHSSLGRLQDTERYHLIEADLAKDTGLPGSVAEGCDVVFHAAAIRNRWGTSPETYRQVNVEGTRRLLAASIGRARRFVYVSSVGVLGYPGVLGIDESFPVVGEAGKSGYHSTKAEAERIVMDAGNGIETTIIRPTITYGPGDRDGMLTRLVELIARGRFLRIGGGRNHMHLTYIDDLVRGLTLAATHPAAAGQTLILAGPASIAVSELVSRIERELGTPHQALFLPEGLARAAGWGVEALYRAGRRINLFPADRTPPITPDKIDTLCIHRGFSSAAAERLIGYSPRVGYQQGLVHTIEWMVDTGRLNRSFSRRKTSTASLTTLG